MRVLRSRFVPAAFLLIAAAACSKATNQGSGAAAQPAPYAANQAATAKPKGYPYTPADVEFMSGMIAHHAQALVMAGWAQSHGAGSSIQTLAGRIINGQQDEIKDVTQQISDFEDRMTLRQQSLQQIYTNLETALGQLQSQSQWLTGQLASLPSISTSSSK